MSILARYITREILISSLATAAVLMLVVGSGRLTFYLSEAVAGDLSAPAVLQIMIHIIPAYLSNILSLGVFIGVVVTLGRLSSDHELVTLFASGLSNVRLLMLVSIPVTFFFLLALALSTIIAPYSYSVIEEIQYVEERTSKFEHIVPGKFQSQNKRQVLYAQSMSDDNSELYDVFIFDKDNSDAPVLIRADIARQEFDEHYQAKYLVLKNGNKVGLGSQAASASFISFDTMGLRMKDVVIEPSASESFSIPTATLFNSSDPVHQAQLHWRFSLPVLTFVIAIVGMGLAQVKPRQGRFARIVPAVILYLGYFYLMVFFRDRMGAGIPNNAINMWLTHLAFLGLGLFLVFGDQWRQSYKARIQQVSLKKAETLEDAP